MSSFSASPTVPRKQCRFMRTCYIACTLALSSEQAKQSTNELLLHSVYNTDGFSTQCFTTVGRSSNQTSTWFPHFLVKNWPLVLSHVFLGYHPAVDRSLDLGWRAVRWEQTFFCGDTNLTMVFVHQNGYWLTKIWRRGTPGSRPDHGD